MLPRSLFLLVFTTATIADTLTTDCEQTLPWNCKCQGEHILDCAFGVIETLNETALLPTGYTGISFAHNELKNLTAGTTWKIVKDILKELDFSFNDIMIIEDGAFRDLTMLETLHLHHNVLRSISSETWKGLTTIEYLDLSFNRLRNLPPDVFIYFSRLQYLNLRYNPILKLNGFLSPLHSLVTLDLDTTGLAKLSPHVFTNTTSLLNLYLSGNAFIEVPTKALSVLDKLTDLDLSDNHFEIIKTQAFKGLVNVRHLTLEKSYALHTIQAHAFDGMTKIRRLSCSYNPHLDYIHPKAFQLMNAPEGTYEGKLEEVILRQNALTSLDQSVLRWMEIVTADLRENPWNCDCHLSWMRKMVWVKVTEKTLAIRCNSPPKLHDRPVQELDITEFICDEEHHDALTSIILFLTLFSVVVFILSLISCWKLNAFSKCQAAYQQQYRRVRKTPSSENAPTERLELDEAQDL